MDNHCKCGCPPSEEVINIGRVNMVDFSEVGMEQPKCYGLTTETRHHKTLEKNKRVYQINFTHWCISCGSELKSRLREE